MLKDALYSIKEQVSTMNEVAVNAEIFTDDPTALLNLSCMCDELIGLIDDDGKGRI